MTDRLTDFKHGRSISLRSATGTCDTKFKVIDSNRPEVEIWQIWDLYSKKNTRKHRLIAKLLLSFRKSRSLNLMAMSEL